jgi:hypothetical protein
MHSTSPASLVLIRHAMLWTPMARNAISRAIVRALQARERAGMATARSTLAYSTSQSPTPGASLTTSSTSDRLWWCIWALQSKWIQKAHSPELQATRHLLIFSDRKCALLPRRTNDVPVFSDLQASGSKISSPASLWSWEDGPWRYIKLALGIFPTSLCG